MDKKELLTEYLSKNYSYEYMRFMLKCIELTECDTLILGSSYGLHGIDINQLSHQVSLSMTSQDLEYDYKLLQHVSTMPASGRIKKVVLILGEYAMYDRMSRSSMGRNIIASVYEPILTGNTDSCWDFTDASNISDEEKALIEKACFELICSKGSFFNNLYTREDNCEDEYRGLVWKNANQAERQKYALHRASRHNRLIESDECLSENRIWINKLAEHCESNHQELYVIIPPFTKEYEQCINPDMKNTLLKELENMPYPVHFNDLNDTVWDGIFDENDFFDMDHLNDNGARKLTSIINELTE